MGEEKEEICEIQKGKLLLERGEIEVGARQRVAEYNWFNLDWSAMMDALVGMLGGYATKS
jgi:hypothetical protein